MSADQVIHVLINGVHGFFREDRGHAAMTQVLKYARLAEAFVRQASGGEVFSKLPVVQVFALFQAGQYVFHVLRILGSTVKFFAHLAD